MGWTGALFAGGGRSRTASDFDAPGRCGPRRRSPPAPVGAEIEHAKLDQERLSAMPPGTPLLEERRNSVARLIALLTLRDRRETAPPPSAEAPVPALAGDGPFKVLDVDTLRDQRDALASRRAALETSLSHARIASRGTPRGAPQGGRVAAPASGNSWPAPPTPIGSACRPMPNSRLRRHALPNWRSRAQTASAVGTRHGSKPWRSDSPRPNWKSARASCPGDRQGCSAERRRGLAQVAPGARRGDRQGGDAARADATRPRPRRHAPPSRFVGARRHRAGSETVWEMRRVALEAGADNERQGGRPCPAWHGDRPDR